MIRFIWIVGAGFVALKQFPMLDRVKDIVLEALGRRVARSAPSGITPELQSISHACRKPRDVFFCSGRLAAYDIQRALGLVSEVLSRSLGKEIIKEFTSHPHFVKISQ